MATTKTPTPVPLQSATQLSPRRARSPFWRVETISQKLTLGFLVILLLLAGSGAVAYFELATVGRDTTTMENASMQAMSASHLQRFSEVVLIPVHDYILTGDPANKARFEKTAADLDALLVQLGGKPGTVPANVDASPTPASAMVMATTVASPPPAITPTSEMAMATPALTPTSEMAMVTPASTPTSKTAKATPTSSRAPHPAAPAITPTNAMAMATPALTPTSDMAMATPAASPLPPTVPPALTPTSAMATPALSPSPAITPTSAMAMAAPAAATSDNSASMAGMTDVASMPLSPEQLGLLANITDLWTNIRAGAQSIFAIPNPVGNQQAISQLEKLEASAQSMSAFSESIHVAQMETVRLSRESANTTILNTSLFLIIVVIVAFVMGALLSRVIGRAIHRPMAHLTQLSTEISLGELDKKVEVRAGGEIGELAAAIERMRTSLKMTIERLTDEEDDLRALTSRLMDREVRRRVRGGGVTLGGQRYDVGRELDGQYVFVKFDYDLREIIVTPTTGEPKHLPLKS